MLQQRIITALIMLAIFLPALFSPSPEALNALILLCVCASAWEWCRLNQCTSTGSVVGAVVCACVCAALWASGMPSQPLPEFWRMTGAAWMALCAYALYRGVAGWGRIPRSVRIFTGLVVLCLAWLAATQARMLGVNFLLSVLVLTWVADSGAYVAGRAWGQRIFSRKLAPGISPGKSWEGVLGGLFSVMLVALGWIALDQYHASTSPSFYTRLLTLGWPLWILGLLLMTCMSVAGDLLESLVKRSAGAKDSSALLPGHGGFLDRLDSLLPVLPLSLMLHSYTS